MGTRIDSAKVLKPEENTQTPKVFISYSWTTPGHQLRVKEWAERLIGDGIEVVMDIYDLREGHDKYAFMEKMVTDPTMSHVLLTCDKLYTEKADARTAGVGAETQIISSEMYNKVEQSNSFRSFVNLRTTENPICRDSSRTASGLISLPKRKGMKIGNSWCELFTEGPSIKSRR